MPRGYGRVTEAHVQHLIAVQERQREDPQWREKVSPVNVPVDIEPTASMNLRVSAEERRALTRWTRPRYPSTMAFLRDAITALLDREGVSPDEVPLWWRT